MTSILLLGFLIGMQHAMEADHVAAVASLATRARSVGDTARQGLVWGLGHTATLFIVGVTVLLLDTMMPERLANWLELGVGIMLILLGLDVLRRLIKDRVHFHLHRHEEVTHFHAHSHPGVRDHGADPHRHVHSKGFPYRAMLVGMMHGMAGSAALIILALETVRSFWEGIFYIFIFGVGSMAGMALLAAAISLPFRYSPRGMTWLHNGLNAAVGLFTLGLGSNLVYQIGWVQGLIG
jgi:ABC-type nickel/cobalt efflux system permease component RcnA